MPPLRGSRVRPLRSACAAILLAASLGLCPHASFAGTARVHFGLGLQQRTFETLTYSDIRPTSRGEVGARADLAVRFSTHWHGSASFHFGGSWFDFSGPVTAGKFEDASWLARLGVERHHPLGERTTLYFGAGAEYGESRSWLDTPASSEEGPRAFFGGGYVRAGAMHQVFGPERLYLEFIQSVQRAHARSAPLVQDYNWLGRSLEGSVGLRTAF